MLVVVAVVAVEDFVAIDPAVMQRLADMKPNYAALVPDTVPLLVVVVAAVAVAVAVVVVAAAAAAAAVSLSGFGAVPMGRHAVRHFERTFH